MSSNSQKCEKLQEDQKFVLKNEILRIRKVLPEDAGFYVCKFNFSVAGIIGEMAENIECVVQGDDLFNYIIIGGGHMGKNTSLSEYETYS